MALRSISLSLFILANALTISAKIFSQHEKVPISNLEQKAPCREYYGMFFIDNTVNGNKNQLEQLGIIDHFFSFGNFDDYLGSVTIISQSDSSVTNNFSVVSPNDYASLNNQIYQVLNHLPTGYEVSYSNLLFEVYDLNFNDKSMYSLNPFLLFFVNSNIEDLNFATYITSEIKKKFNVKIVAIVMDNEYTPQAAQLVGEKDNVYIYNSTDENRIDKINDWILQETCFNKGLPPITLPPTTLPPTTLPPIQCNSHINFVIVATSENLTNIQFNKQKNLIKDYILPMWTDFSNFSFSVIKDDYGDECTTYNTFFFLNNVQTYISRLEFSSIADTDLVDSLFCYVNRPSFINFLSEMTTFIFLPYISENEINQTSDYATTLSNYSTLNIIKLGENMEKFDVSILSPTNVIGWNYAENSIPSIQQFVSNTIKCN